MTRNDIRIQFNKEKDLPVLTTDGTGYIHYSDDYVHWLEEIALKQVSGADTSTDSALPIQNVMASVSDELLLRAGKYEDEANADFDTDGVQHNLNIGRYDGLMQAVQEINKHLQ